VDKYADRLFRFAYKNTRQEADARDIVQHSFEKLWRKREEVDFQKAKSYLFTTAYHAFVDDTRKRNRLEMPGQVPERDVQGGQEGFELKDSLEMALAQLPDVQRQVVLLRDYEGYSYKEIAGLARLSEAQVKVYIFRARKKLQDILTRMERVG
jgi:RNA polymerase sigma-70 factor (ECF subfamily)